MTTISAHVVCDSISTVGKRITTLQLRYPRFIHSEFMTHRVFSRNASSSRAIPVERLIQDVIDNPAIPLSWGKNQKGMQAGEDIDPINRSKAQASWLVARNRAVEQAQKLVDLGLHKQIVNRLLEPFAHINVVCTATEWDNFFQLRRHPDAEPHIHMLADAMFEALSNSTPENCENDEWHVPYVKNQDHFDVVNHYRNVIKVNPVDKIERALLMISAARCARVSYKTHDGQPTTVANDLKLAERLLADKHMSPFEHQARPRFYHQIDGEDQLLTRNFRGWAQHRALV